MKFTDRQLLDMAVQCLKHARQSTAIRDCQCAACRGFMEQSEELLATIEQPTPETSVAACPVCKAATSITANQERCANCGWLGKPNAPKGANRE